MRTGSGVEETVVSFLRHASICAERLRKIAKIFGQGIRSPGEDVKLKTLENEAEVVTTTP